MSIKADAEQVVGTHTFDSTTQMDSSVKEILEGTDYAASSLKLLTGGNTNFIYLAQLEKPLPDGTAEVVIKHGEEFVALNPDWNIGTTRCHIEEQSLRLLDQFPQFTSPACQVRSPRLLHFNAANNTQIQEYLPKAVNLKDYARKHFETPSPEAMRPHCLQIGRGLGQWLRAFHEWSDQPAQSNVRELFATNSSLQNLKKMINYDRLLHMVTKYPSFLEDSKDIFQQVIDMTAAELQDQTKLHAIHGDFWTGNILIPDTPLADGQQIQLRIVDWEMGQLGVRPEDFGQLVAELWELKLYKDIDAGLWVIEGFADGYGSVDDDFVFRALIHTGAHLVSMGSNTPGWGTPEQGEQVAKAGNDVLVKAWKKDRTWFDKHDLACAFH